MGLDRSKIGKGWEPDSEVLSSCSQGQSCRNPGPYKVPSQVVEWKQMCWFESQREAWLVIPSWYSLQGVAEASVPS